jgi:hypothetical protein
MSGIISDNLGNVYGTALSGGVSGCGTTNGGGTIFKMDHSGAVTVLDCFRGRNGWMFSLGERGP